MSRVGLPLLTAWGVSADADLVFRTLIAHGSQTGTDLHRALGLPAARVRRALDELAACDAVTPDPGPARSAGRRWRGREPQTVVDGLRVRQRAAAAAAVSVGRWLPALPQLDVDLRLTRGDTVLARPLHGAARVRARLAELVGSVRHEHLSMHPEPVFSAAAVRAAAPLDRALFARRVSVLTLGVPPGPGDAAAAHGADLARNGLRYRELPSLPTKLIVVDRRVAILPFDPHDPARGALELTAPLAVPRLVEWFLRRWDVARSPGPEWDGTPRLSSRERSIVALLSAGHPDADVAERLGLSVRTVAYSVRSLMDRYRARNRFQLGMVLGAAGAGDPGRITHHTDWEDS
jgi:DNA-binding CsgD family transcriptional regulator